MRADVGGASDAMDDKRGGVTVNAPEDPSSLTVGCRSTAATAFADHAARISCYASLGLYVIGGASTLSPLLLGLFVLMESAAFVLGIVGVVGGVRQRTVATIRMGTLGALLSGLPLAVLGVMVALQ